MPPMHIMSTRERRLALLAIGAAVAVFVGLLIAVPALFVTFDEAKYIGIGRSVLAGHGPRIAFGSYFLPHSPIWAAVLVAPERWFGIDPLSWGHTLNAVSGAGLLVLTGILGWRIRPAVGALAVVGYVAVTYLHDLTRTARLDVPAAALILLYLVVGLEAVRRGSVRWSIAAGICFALAFLTKEIALPFAPVPFLAGILRGRPWPSLAKVAGWTLLLSAIGTSWWFAFVAVVGHTVYRLGTPVWTLLPLTIAVVIAAGLGIVAEPVLARRARSAGGALPPPSDHPSRQRTALAWGLALLWFAALTAFFARTLGGRATALIDPRQIAHYLHDWLPGLTAMVVFAWIGVFLSLGAWWAARSQPPTALAHAEAWLAVVCTAPLVLLVIGVGEPPRNYLAQLGLLAILSVTGWLWAAEAVARRSIGWLATRRPTTARRLLASLERVALPTFLALAVLGSAGVLTVHALRYRTSESSGLRAQAIATATSWVRDHVAPGSTVAFGSFLSYEMANELSGYRLVQIRQEIARATPNAPEGLVAEGLAAAPDFVSADIAPRNVNEYQAYQAGQLSAAFRRTGATTWVYSIGTTTSAPTILAAVGTATGIHEVAHWSWTDGTQTIETHILAVDPQTLQFDPNRLYLAPDALARLVSHLERTPGRSAAAARLLLQRIVVTGDPLAAQPALDRLRTLAGH